MAVFFFFFFFCIPSTLFFLYTEIRAFIIFCVWCKKTLRRIIPRITNLISLSYFFGEWDLPSSIDSGLYNVCSNAGRIGFIVKTAPDHDDPPRRPHVRHGAPTTTASWSPGRTPQALSLTHMNHNAILQKFLCLYKTCSVDIR